MSVAWLTSRKGPSDSPPQGATDGPSSAYPLALRAGRSGKRALLPRRRRLPNPQPPPQALRVPQEALGLGGHLACAPAAAPWRAERALVLARCAEVLLPPVRRGSGDVPFLLQPAGEETQALPGAPAAADRPRARRRARDPRGGFDAAFGVAPAPGRAVAGLRGSGLGEVGFVQRLRGQAAPALRYQPGSRLLRAHPRQRGGRLPDRGTRSRGGFGGRGSKEALRGPGLPQRGAGGCPGRNGDPARERTLPTAREQAAGGDSASEPQARVPPRGDVGNHPRGARQQDRGESYGLHVWLLRQPPAGPSSRSHQGAVGLRSSQHSSRRAARLRCHGTSSRHTCKSRKRTMQERLGLRRVLEADVTEFLSVRVESPDAGRESG